MHNHSREKDDKVRFFPNVLLAEMSLAIAVIGLLAVFVSLFPLKLGEKFDPLNPPSILEPEWYFMGFYQFLKTQDVTPLHGIILMAGVAIFIVLIPFLDRSEERRPSPKAYLHSRCLSDGNRVPRPNNLRIPVPRPNWVFLKPQVHDRLHYSQFNCGTFDHTGFRSQQTGQKRYTTMSDRRNFTRTGRLLLLALAFGVSVFALSNLMPLLLQVATKGFTILDGLLIAGNLFVGTVAVAFLAKAMYRLDKKAGRIRNKVGWFE